MIIMKLIRKKCLVQKIMKLNKVLKKVKLNFLIKLINKMDKILNKRRDYLEKRTPDHKI